MATKITILGEEPQKKELKKIELIHCLQTMHCGFSEIRGSNYSSDDDIIVVSKEPNYKHNGIYYSVFVRVSRVSSSVWLGHFNDGVV
jgi:hypothetical protein